MEKAKRVCWMYEQIKNSKKGKTKRELMNEWKKSGFNESGEVFCDRTFAKLYKGD